MELPCQNKVIISYWCFLVWISLGAGGRGWGEEGDGNERYVATFTILHWLE